MDGCELKIVHDDIPDAMLAAFRLGRLKDALDFANIATEAQAVPRMPPELTEGKGAHSNLDDVGLTVAHAGWRALKMFKAAFHHEYSTKQVIERLIFETPIAHIEAARKLNDIIDSRNLFLLAEDAERIAEVLEDIVSFGRDSAFTPGGKWRFPLELIVDMWNNQSIDIEISPRAAPGVAR
ncbi:hypothetical protein GOB57_21010 [Sinorhizobium meliloti]|nr:hypothetical protein [Sinorhizobium meliloti]